MILLQKNSTRIITSTLILTVFTFSFFNANGQENKKQEKNSKKITLIGYPLAFYLPETSWGIGAYGITTFRFKNQKASAPPSQVNLLAVYTVLNQLKINAPFKFYINDRAYIIKGELGYYRYNYQYFGRGNIEPKTNNENYKINYPKLEIVGIKQIAPNIFAGLNYQFQSSDIVKKEENGLLENQDITGANGGVISGIGPSFTYDSRDNVFYPSKGVYVNLNSTFHSAFTGSSFNYGKVAFDISTYIKDKFNNIIGLNYIGAFNTGNPPFNDLSELGGSHKGRGLFLGKYRDKILNLVQIEYRYPIYWRFSGATFASYSGVSNKLSNYSLANNHFNYGTGIRYQLDKKEKINLRLDIATGNQNVYVYITLAEAF